MIESINIENFKCFQHLTLKNLGKVNVIVGPNSSGKTVIMESIFLASGSTPELAIRAKSLRGLSQPNIQFSKSAYELYWRDMFYHFDQKSEIKITLDGPDDHYRDLSISYKQPHTVLIPISSFNLNQENPTPVLPLVFEWKTKNFGNSKATPELLPAGISINFDNIIPSLPTAFYTSSFIPSPEENAGYFSMLSINNRSTFIVEAIKKEFPHIQNLSVEVVAGTPSVYASVDGVIEKLPMNLVSSGVSKLLSILLGIANQENGIVCIDEIENGFYFDRLPSIWNLIISFAEQFNVQIFASSHSLECLKALNSIDTNKSNLRLIQAMPPNHKSRFRVINGESFMDALENNIEVR